VTTNDFDVYLLALRNVITQLKTTLTTALEKIMKVVESIHNPPLSGRLALHIACRKGKTSLNAVLVDKNPDAVRVHDSKHKLPIHYASALQPSLPPIVL